MDSKICNLTYRPRPHLPPHNRDKTCHSKISLVCGLSKLKIIKAQKIMEKKLWSFTSLPKNLERGSISGIGILPKISAKNMDQREWGKPGRAYRLEVSLCLTVSDGPANICLLNIYFSIFMSVAFLPLEIPNQYPQQLLLHHFFFLPENGISSPEGEVSVTLWVTQFYRSIPYIPVAQLL